MNTSSDSSANESHGYNWAWFLIAGLAVLFCFSLYLAFNRIYQVDEAQNVYMAKIVGLGQTGSYFSTGSLFLLGPLSWVARVLHTSSAFFDSYRLMFLAVFWANLFLLALCTGIPVRSRGFLIAFFAASTLTPLWDYGIEIRHDNLLLTVLLLQWFALRRWKARPEAVYTALGALSGLMQFIAFKAVLFWVPLLAVAVAFPPPRVGKGMRVRLTLALLAGLICSALAAMLAYSLSGTWSAYINGLRTSIGHSENPGRFAPWTSLERILTQAPLLAGASVGAVLALSVEIHRRGKAAFSWDGALPEAFLFLGTFAVLLINPVPYPYNLVLVVPFAFLLALKWICLQLDGEATSRAWFPMALGIVAFTHLVPFAMQTLRHLEFSNDRQKELMGVAESLTDPTSDRVYDAAGLVPSRESIGYQWFLHSLVMEKLNNGKLPSVREMIAHQPPSVILLSYRTDWLSAEDKAFISDHYVTLSDDCLVLGAALPAGTTDFQCLHSGRYVVIPGDGKDTLAPANAMFDHSPTAQDGIIQLQAGPHKVSVPAGHRVVVAWIGPTLTGLPRIPQSPHQRTFINWY